MRGMEQGRGKKNRRACGITLKILKGEGDGAGKTKKEQTSMWNHPQDLEG